MKLKIEAKTEEEKIAADHFLSWLDGQGEQEYWLWMEYRERETKTGNITVRRFNYDFKKNEVELELGRMDSRE